MPTATALPHKRWRTGTVVHGDGRGQSLGFPTANIIFPSNSDLPSPAIYAAWVKIPPHPATLPAAVHVGPRPTFPGATPSFEVHIIDFPSQDLHGQKISVLLVKKIRQIAAFPSPQALVLAMRADVTKALEILQPAAHA